MDTERGIGSSMYQKVASFEPIGSSISLEPVGSSMHADGTLR
jgi:hypothetical protein